MTQMSLVPTLSCETRRTKFGRDFPSTPASRSGRWLRSRRACGTRSVLTTGLIGGSHNTRTQHSPGGWRQSQAISSPAMIRRGTRRRAHLSSWLEEDFVEKNTAVMPIPSWMGDDLLKNPETCHVRRVWMWSRAKWPSTPMSEPSFEQL